MIDLGTLAAGVVATVGDDGTIACGSTVLRGRVVGRDGRLRSERPGAAPLAQTSVRVRGGEVVHRSYAVDHAVVVEVENASPEPVAVAFVLDGARAGGPQLRSVRPPGAVEADGTMVFPLPHRLTLRIVLARDDLDVRALPSAHAVAQGWERLLEHGMRTELTEPLQSQVDAARADLLLAAPSADAFVDLEAWGFDAAASAMWARLGMSARRRARRAASSGVLAETRDALVREVGATVALVPEFRPEWLGRPLAVHDAPLRRGRCSFAIRWHGARPALLWDVPAGMRVRIPALDSRWESTEPVGETLLGEPPVALLSMGRADATGGVPVEAPEAFT
jgi:hypothetical protein